MTTRIQIRRDTTANWVSVDPVLAEGEIGYDLTTNEFKVGDGSSSWTALDANGGGSSKPISTPILTYEISSIQGSGATSLDFSSHSTHAVTMIGNVTLDFANAKPGQMGVIYLIQNGTGGHNFTLPAEAKTPKGQAISQEVGANSIATLSYTVLNPSTVLVNYMGDFA